MADLRLMDMFDHALASVPGATRIRVRLGEAEMEVERVTLPATAPAYAGATVVSHMVENRSGTAPAGGEIVKAPLVGVFYTASDPDAPPFAKVGQRVKKGDTLCIIEAMKHFNEIESTCAGTVESILAENGAMVEFGQPLFSIRSDG